MAQLRIKAGLRKALNEEHFSKIGYVDKCNGSLAYEAQYGSGSVHCSCFIRVAESWGEDSSPPVYFDLCSCSLELRLAETRRRQEKAKYCIQLCCVGVKFEGWEIRMVRERMPCRRGSGSGQFPRPPAADLHHHCCCVYCYRRVGANPISANQFMEVGSSVEGQPWLPAFGSAIFTLGSSEAHEGVNAHISVLFTKIPAEDDEGSSLVLAEDDSVQEKGKFPLEEQTISKACSEKGKGKALLGEMHSAAGPSGEACLQPHPHLRSHAQQSPAQSPLVMEESASEDEGGSRSMEEETED